MNRILGNGADGFIGGHLVKRLKSEVFGFAEVDLKEHEYCPSSADEFIVGDLRDPSLVAKVVRGDRHRLSTRRRHERRRIHLHGPNMTPVSCTIRPRLTSMHWQPAGSRSGEVFLFLLGLHVS
jgi:nucleoside-diphosphate-sugar epimerase